MMTLVLFVAFKCSLPLKDPAGRHGVVRDELKVSSGRLIGASSAKERRCHALLVIYKAERRTNLDPPFPFSCPNSILVEHPKSIKHKNRT